MYGEHAVEDSSPAKELTNTQTGHLHWMDQMELKTYLIFNINIKSNQVNSI